MKHVCRWSCGVLGVAIACSSPALFAVDFDIENVDGVPHYADVVDVVDQETEETTRTLSLHEGGKAWRASTLDQIFGAYGMELDPEKVESHAGYVTVVEVPDEENGEPKKALSFNTDGKAWSASSLHSIISLYGLEFNFDDVAEVDHYATVNVTIDPETEEEVHSLAFDPGSKMWTAAGIHSILSAYR